MVRFSEPDAWTGDFWKSNLRYQPKGHEPPKGISQSKAVNLHNFDTESPYAQLPSSPNSAEAMRLTGVRPEFLLYRPPEAFNAIGITPDRVMMRYEAHEALRRETITMLRTKRQEVMMQRAEERKEQEGKASPASPILELEEEGDSDWVDSPASEAGSEATTRSAHSEEELTHTQQLLRDQRTRLAAISEQAATVMNRRVQHERDVQRDQDELREFVDNKMLRIGNIEKERARNKAERIRIAGERERNKLIRRQEMARRDQERAVKEARLSKQRMEESEAKREEARLEKERVIREENEARRAEAEERKQELLAACERKEQHEKACMEAKMEAQNKRYEAFIEERQQQLEMFREQQERKSLEAAARVQYITENKVFNSENTQAKRMSELADREYKAMLRKRKLVEEKRQRSIAKQEKAEDARKHCAQQQVEKEQRIARNIERKAKVSGKMAVIKKTKLDRKLEEANIINMNRVEKLQRLVARNEYKDSQYLVVAKKREGRIQSMVDNKKVLMHERRLILYDMAQTELKAREELKRIRLRLPPKSDAKKKKKKKSAWETVTSEPNSPDGGSSLMEQTRAESALF